LRSMEHSAGRRRYYGAKPRFLQAYFRTGPARRYRLDFIDRGAYVAQLKPLYFPAGPVCR